MEYDFNEYNDPDATACALGDYNAWEDEQVFLDDEGRWDAEDYNGYDDYEDRYDYFED